MSIYKNYKLVTLDQRFIAETIARTGSEQLLDKLTRSYVGLYDNQESWYLPLRANIGKNKPPGAFFETPFPTDNPHFKRPGIDFEKALFVPDEFIIPIRNTLPQEQAKLINEQSNIISDDFEQYVLKLENVSKKSPSYRFSTVPLFPDGMEKIKQITSKEREETMENELKIQETNEEIIELTEKQKYINLLKMAIEEGEISATQNLNEAIYLIDDIKISGDFDYGVRGLDHNVLLLDDQNWVDILQWGTIIVPETSSYISDKSISELEEIGYHAVPLVENHKYTMEENDLQLINDLAKLKESAAALNTSVKEADAEKFSKLSPNQRQAILSELTSQQNHSSEYPSNKPEIESPDFEI